MAAAAAAVGDRGSPAERLDRITSWVSDDPALAAACSAAVDPVEIAARLESHGVSSQVAVDAFGYADVFSTAEAVYRGRALPGRRASGRRASLRGAGRWICCGARSTPYPPCSSRWWWPASACASAGGCCRSA